MSGAMPLFATAPRLKIYIKDQPVAYALGFNINISVEVQDVYVIGQYAPVTNEPTMYNLVTGTMQIQRLVSQTTQNQLNALAGAVDQLTDQNGRRAVADFANTAQGGESTTVSGTSNSILAQSELTRHLDPTKVLTSQAFNIRVYMKVPKIDGGNFATTTPILEEKEWMQIQNCRITSESMNITMGQLVNIPVNFQGLLATSAIAGLTQFQLDNAIKQASVTGQ
jgi:hypothetical protein